VALDAAAHGHHQFGAVLVGPDDKILMRQGNINTVHHAEVELARRPAASYPPEFLWTCTMVSTGELNVEPSFAQRTQLRPERDRSRPFPEIEDELLAPHRNFWTRGANNLPF
jgi:hypothetical protein